ncbi:hypothetical protein Barb6_00893 [Bacteroidales bacterium Barb6]|nr:hypothetical protein Barb6XT_01214 [Bacteroidales bacterium Barb6XT]OAV72695.1 hypothetical protein Barb6_00893 [Bacteroidales bacterium Barb6]OAV74425.1 hypothetical protein Barb7_02079 [Bacteroidales bacterium Barb7]
MTKYLIIALVACLSALAAGIRDYGKIRQDRDRLKENQEVFFKKAEYYRTKDSLSAAGIETLVLKKKELESYNRELLQTVQDLDIQIKRVESVSQTASQTTVEINVPVRDTVFVIDSIPIPAQTFEWKDNWVSVGGIIKSGEISCRVQSTDTLVQIVHRIPHTCWFIRWGTKALRQEVVSKNPHSEIIYTEYIKLTK